MTPPASTNTPMTSSAITLADIARACNLSKGSVSRALSMTAEACPLSPATRRRVLKVSQEMGYRVNAQARALASGKSMSIGLLYEGTLPILESVYHQIVETFAATLRQYNYHLALVALDDTDHWEQALFGGRVDGCVCLHSLPKRMETIADRVNLPIVLLNGKSALVHGSVSVDDRKGAVLLTEHLLSLGHRRILMLTDTQRETPHYSIGERQTGFLHTMRKSGLACAEPMCFEGNAQEFGEAWSEMKDKPTAVISYSHVEAINALRVLRRAGVDVPSQVSLATFNDVFPVADLDPSLTCINIQAADIGQAGGEMLMKLLGAAGKKLSLRGDSLVIEPVLIARESTQQLAS